MWKRLVVWFCALGAARAQAQETQSRVVQIVQGPVRGYMEPEGDIFSFINIPYATAPTGVHRFMAPLPPPVWTATFDAVDRRVFCPQAQITPNMQEDCLVANVYAPDTEETNLSVVVYVHGGAYHVRSGTYDSVKRLVRTKKIVAITFNYRLGVHGFLCLGTKDIPGNAGMKDQVALLRWVKRNIANFGGNPDDVTIYGCSAGGGSVDFLTLSKMTDGLFVRAIPESGCNMGALGIQNDPLENAQGYARVLDFHDVEDINALEEFYKTAPYQLLTSRTDTSIGRTNSSIPFAPCVERDTGVERFLDDAPVNIMRNGNYTSVPLLFGFTNMEGAMRLGSFNSWRDRMNDKFSDFLPADLQFESEEQKDEVAQTIKEFYFGDQPVSEDNILTYIDYFTDILFMYPVLRSVKLRKESKNDTIYLYKYSFVDDNASTVPFTNVSGAYHCSQGNMVLTEDTTNRTENFMNMHTLMGEYWLNFIFTGNPVPAGAALPAWPVVGADWAPHMSLGRTVELKQEFLKHEHVLFWEDIYQRHYRYPVPPAVTDSAINNAVSKFLLAFILIIGYINL